MESGFLKEYGLKNTPGRQAVLEVLAHAQEPLAADAPPRLVDHTFNPSV